jgi:hypothetical protein
MTTNQWISTLFVSVFALAGPSHAAPVTQCGTNICYDYDDAQLGKDLFGLPTLSGDSLIFLSPSFRAESLNGDGTDTAEATFVIDSVYSVNGGDIMDLVIYESGDYEITNGGSVSAELILDVENNNSAETGSTGDIITALGDSGGQQEWSLLADYDPHSVFTEPSNDVKVSITDILIADANTATESAWIQKKLTLSAASVVPVPAAIWLFGSGIGLLGWMRRKRR